MVANVFQLNQDKTEDLVIGPSAQREKLWPKLQDFKPSQSVKFLWFLNLILILTRFYFIYQKLKDFLPSCVFSQTPPIKVSTEVLMHAFISSPLDSCKAMLSSLPEKSIYHLQFLQNSSVNKYQRAEAHYTSLKIAALVPVGFRVVLRFFY